MSDEFHTALMEQEPGEFIAKPSVHACSRIWAASNCGGAGAPGRRRTGRVLAADRRRNVRWERVSEVLRDLEELRGVGERLLTANRGDESVAAQPGGGDTEGS